MFGHHSFSKLNAKWSCLTQILVKCFQTLDSAFKMCCGLLIFIFSLQRPAISWCIIIETMVERSKKDDNFLWWRLTCNGDDQTCNILDSHNRPQRSHKIIITSINNPPTVIRSVQIAYDIRGLYSSRGTIRFYLLKNP